ncbi:MULTISPECIES: Nif11-like leader peptide family RiPP precursor [Anoxynatronum]|uniref:Nif11-like leader peptide domain-containing protein n=2 Tax=Anoxynatronum TaxID=210622 RepID=A0AA45WW58_9CLOT|nr:Nif11-like leader peptide family RiPP precursor [Anoxynatronum buryatiense]SMP57963.1 nif11-like leader peptide domain-containing protein [Anoxynatronum buryatiense]
MEDKLRLLQQKLEADEQLAEKLFQLETPEEVQVFLKENDVEMTIEEINAAREALITSITPSETGELSEENLDRVAGGSMGEGPRRIRMRMHLTW